MWNYPQLVFVVVVSDTSIPSQRIYVCTEQEQVHDFIRNTFSCDQTYLKMNELTSGYEIRGCDVHNPNVQLTVTAVWQEQ